MRQINVERFKAARRSVIELGSHKITITRPTPWDIAMSQENGGRPDITWAAGYVIDWDFQEIDLIPGGDPEPVAFNTAVFCDWIKDFPQHWGTLINGVIGAYQAYESALEARGNV